MRHIPLSDETTKIILGGESGQNLESLDAGEQRAIIRRLANIAGHEAAPNEFVYEKIGNLDIIRVGDQIRLYTKVVTGIPSGNAEYHVIYVFYIDSEHNYDRTDLATYHPQAQLELERMTSLSSINSVESYLEENNALGEADLREKLDR